MPNIYEWLNKEKSRYYTITVQKDGTSDIVLNFRWGGCNSNRGGKKNIFVQTEEEVKRYISNMMKRRKSRGYELIAPLHG
jgi:predicted DNA-binding WGR domain protein